MDLKSMACLALFSLLLGRVQAQINHPAQVKSFKLRSDTLILDSLSILPGSVKLIQTDLPDSSLRYKVDYTRHALVFLGKRPDSVKVSYTRLPYNFEKSHFHKDASELYRDYTRPRDPFTIQFKDQDRQNLFVNDGLTKNGNISRGISFGNNQDMVVNSNLNLQVNGKLSPEVDIMMAATDNNIPFQADGTTAQLQEFDKVYIQLSNPGTKLIVGDYQLSRPQSAYFMNFYKRAQGAYIENTTVDSSTKKPMIFKTQFAGAVSKGKFSRQVFYGTENNQGPYRLKGADNEPFIIVLSGTEKIYIDGKLLQRGQENDYIIDYNSGELTFTARQIITKDKRIVAEFQYAERNYARSLLYFGEEVQSGKTKYYFNAFSEQDNKNKPLQQTLTQQQKNVLIDAGDSLQKAVYSGATQSTFNSNEVFYRRTDSLLNGILYKDVYVYSRDPDSAHYSLKFSYLGPGKGNYNLFSNNANGRVYQWVAPLNGQAQGSYEPVYPLVSPKQNQMILAGFTHSASPLKFLQVEGVYTKNDINRFSTLDKGNDEAGGLKIQSRNQSFLRKDSAEHARRLVYNYGYEFVQQNFKQIERFRTVEFDRDWNRPLTGQILGDQNIANAELGLNTGGGKELLYGASYFSEGSLYQGLKQNIRAAYAKNKFNTFINASYLSTTDKSRDQLTGFYRHKSQLAQNFGKMRLAYNDELEHNVFNSMSTQTLMARSYNFWDWEGSLSNADSSKTKYKVFYRERRDQLAYDGALKDSTLANNYGLQFSSNAIKNNPFTVLITYRNLHLSQNIRGTSLKPDNALLNRIEYNPRYWKGFVSANLFYETGYGLENKREYYYLEVAPGQGQYTWKDYNGNQIKELNEFETAQFSDQANYIRIYTPTNEYVKILQNQLSVSFNIRPAQILKKPEKQLTRFIARWAFQTTFRLDNKIGDRPDLKGINPFFREADSAILAANNNIRQSVFFNQSSAVFGADYTYINNQSKQLLTNGLENKILISHLLRWRYNFHSAWTIFNDNTLSRKGNSSEFFSSRNYLIDAYELQFSLAYQPSTRFRISAIYKYNNKYNTMGSISAQSEPVHQKALLNTLAMEMRYNQTEKGSLTARFDMIRIDYNDVENSSIAYEMMNGLNKGDNFTWELVYQRNLNANLQLSFNYNGRKNQNGNPVHIGGAQVKAFF
ncbi:MAG TPA: hypothetical protein PLQ93_01145 [Bacteroidia bacterium]|nr:hypothetical protein [Bacteroidia bacterium]